MEKTFGCYITEQPEARALKERLNTLEAELAKERNAMALGYADPAAGGAFVKASSVQLRTNMRVSDQEPLRAACYQGLRAIGPVVAPRFLDIVRARNRLARLMGYQDFYDYKASRWHRRPAALHLQRPCMGGAMQQHRQLLLLQRLY